MDNGPEFMDLDRLKTLILAQDRRALAQAITLSESDRMESRADRFQLLQEILPHTGASLRLGISGVPGVGKSTFIETFGLYALEQGKKVAVLAIDPSSPKSRGSILGDKTRMTKLASHKDAFIRPSPSGGILGGVNRHTRESILLCEAAGFDLILIETVGVGQLEADVVDMVDLSLLLLSPTGGDHVQGMKKGLLELVDLIVVNKADGDLKALAYQMVKEFMQALKLNPKAVAQKVMLCSALEGHNMDKIFQNLMELDRQAEHAGEKGRRRQQQEKTWFWEKVEQYVIEDFKTTLAQTYSAKDLEALLEEKPFPPLVAYELVKKR